MLAPNSLLTVELLVNLNLGSAAVVLLFGSGVKSATGTG